AGSFWFGLIAVLLLFVCNYVLARVVALAIDRMMQRRAGSALLLALVMGLAIAPSLLAQLLKRRPDLAAAPLRWFAYSPPFGAAAAMIHAGFPAVNGILLILGWIAVLLVLLLALENRPPVRTAAASSKIAW